MKKGAIIGFGQVVEAAHAPAFRALSSEIKIEAVADERPERLAKAQELFPGVRTYKTASELLANEKSLDFVDVATPPQSHPALVLLGLSRGLHVLVEKPLALTREDLERVAERAAQTGRTVFTIDNWKHAPIFLKLKEIVAAGALGDVRHLELHVLRTQPAAAASGSWRADAASGGLLVDHGWHAFYLLRHLSGLEPTGVTCRERRGDGDDECTLLVELGPATALVHMTWASSFRSNWGLVLGTKGSAEMRDDILVVRTADSEEAYTFPEKLSAGSAHPEWFQTMLPDFLLEMTDPAARGRNLDEAEACLFLIENARRTLTEAHAP